MECNATPPLPSPLDETREQVQKDAAGLKLSGAHSGLFLFVFLKVTLLRFQVFNATFCKFDFRFPPRNYARPGLTCVVLCLATRCLGREESMLSGVAFWKDCVGECLEVVEF